MGIIRADCDRLGAVDKRLFCGFSSRFRCIFCKEDAVGLSPYKDDEEKRREIRRKDAESFFCRQSLISYCNFEDVLPLIEMRKTPFLTINPKTVIVLLFPFYVGDYPKRNIARYAIINDYHKVCGHLLSSLAAQLKAAFPKEEFVPLIDSSPIREVKAAKAAGLGVIGRHGMLIHEKYGSRVFIGTIVTGLSFAPALKPRDEKTCLNCNKCIQSCPTGAISADKPLDRKLCRSAISQKKSALTDWEKNQIKAGGFVWGCDLCADACPMNIHAEKTPIEAFYEDIVPVLTRENLARAIADKPYNWRGEKVLLRNISLLEEK